MPSTKPVLKIRLEPEEKAIIETAAKEAGLSASEFALQCCLRKTSRMSDRKDLLVLNLIERAVMAVEQIASGQEIDCSPTVVASNLAKADRLVERVGELRSMLWGRRG